MKTSKTKKDLMETSNQHNTTFTLTKENSMETSNKLFSLAICIALAVCFSALMATNASADDGVEAQGQSFSAEKSAIVTDPGSSVESDPAAGPRRDEPGDVLRTYELPYNRILGLAWDDDHGWMWGYNNSDPPCLYVVDPENGNVVADFRVRNELSTLLYLNGILYIGGNTNLRTIYRYDTEGNELEPWVTDVDIGRIFGVATDGELIFTNIRDESRIHVFDQQGNEIAAIEYGEVVGDARIFNIEWVAAHPDGQLWLYAAGGHMYQCFINDDWNCELEQDFETIVQVNNCAIAHDGENLWLGPHRSGELMYVIDDGTEEVAVADWLSYDPDEGEVEAEGQAEVTVTINCEGLVQGLYEADMTFASNDPDDEGIVVSIGIDVVGAPNIEVTWLDEYGYPDVVDWNAAFDDVFTGTPYEIRVEVTNTGTADLDVDEIFCENEYFTADPVDMILEHDQSAEVTFTFATPEGEPGNFEAVMVFASNDPDNRELEVALHAEALLPPEIRVEPNAIEDELFTGAVEEYEIIVFNDGEAPLRFTVTHEIVGEPERDAVNRYRGRRGVRSVRRTTGGDARPTGNSSLFR